jgi:hypothetical protein
MHLTSQRCSFGFDDGSSQTGGPRGDQTVPAILISSFYQAVVANAPLITAQRKRLGDRTGRRA